MVGIKDFTTASELERPISKLEEVLNDWKLVGNSLGNPLEKEKRIPVSVFGQS
jgi:Rab3 GTPase-activating protein catalytic subunit